MKETVNNFWRNFRKYPDIWLFFVFLLSFPLSIRKVLFFFPLGGIFNEYTGLYLYASDLLFILTILGWLFSILCNYNLSLSRCKSAFRKLFHNLYLSIPAALVLLSFLSTLWSQNQLVALYRSIKLLELYLLYLYTALRFITFALFHVEQFSEINRNDSNVPHLPCGSKATLRGGTICQNETISQGAQIKDKLGIHELDKNGLNKSNDSGQITFQTKSDDKTTFEANLNVPRGTLENENDYTLNCSTCLAGRRAWNNFLKIITLLGLSESLIGIGQFFLQHSIGLFYLKESLISTNIPGVAKIILNGERYIRAYGLFPHPNVLGGFLLFSIILTLLYKKQLFHVEQFPETDQNSEIVPPASPARLAEALAKRTGGRGTFVEPENTSLGIRIYPYSTSILFEENGLNKSNDLGQITFNSKSKGKTASETNLNVPRGTLENDVHCDYLGSIDPEIVSHLSYESKAFLQNEAMADSSFQYNPHPQTLQVFSYANYLFKMFHVEHFKNLRNRIIHVIKSLSNLKRRIIQKIQRLTIELLKLFHVEQLQRKLTKHDNVPRGTSWLIKDLQNTHFSFKKLGFKKSWLINAILWIQLVALFLSFSKSAIIGFLIALIYIKLFHVEHYAKANNLARNNCSTWNNSNINPLSFLKLFKNFKQSAFFSEMFHVEHFRKIILIILIAVFSIILMRPNLNSLLFQSLEERMFYINTSPVVVSITDLVSPEHTSQNNQLFHVEQFPETDQNSEIVPPASLACLAEALVKRAGGRGTFADLSVLTFGIGAGQFVLSLSEYAKKSLEIWQFQPVHNIYLEMWSELGIVGLGLFLWLIWKLFHVEQFAKHTKIKNCSTWNIQRNKEINSIVPRGTIELSRTKQLKNEQGSSTQNSELKESILCNDCNSLSINITLRYFQAILLGLLFIGLFDHYLWDIWPGQVLLWLVMGIITGIRIHSAKDIN